MQQQQSDQSQQVMLRQQGMLRCRISSDLDDMGALHAQYPWVPGRQHIRPSEAVLALKREAMARTGGTYNVDEWCTRFFGMPLVQLPGTYDGKQYHFEPNTFPYDVPEGVHHYVLWFPTSTPVDDATVNACCTEAVLARHGNDFVWYVNPKMTVPDIWHVQVFWK